MKNLTESDKVKFRRFIRKNWSQIVEDLKMDTSVPKEDVEKVLDSLHCYILFTDKDKDICPLSKSKIRK